MGQADRRAARRRGPSASRSSHDSQAEDRGASRRRSSRQAGRGRRRPRRSSRSCTASATTCSSKLETVSLGYLPGPERTPPYFGVDWQPKIPKIQQVVLDEYDRNAYDQPVARVDRCTSCHAGIDKAGFEDQPNPWKTHPRREVFLGKHPTGEVRLHAVPQRRRPGREQRGVGARQLHRRARARSRPSSPARGACALPRREDAGQLHQVPRRRAAARRRRRRSRAARSSSSTSAATAATWREGYEDLSKERRRRRRSDRRCAGIGAKAEPGWLVRWVTNPHEYPAAHAHAELHVRSTRRRRTIRSRSPRTCSPPRRSRATNGSRGIRRPDDPADPARGRTRPGS